MFWAERLAGEAAAQHAKKTVSGKPLIIRDEKTPSGRVHVGSMRGVAIHGLISEVLTQKGIANEFHYEFNDMDPMDGLPVYLDEAIYRPYMGMPLFRIPPPDGDAKNFAEYFATEFQNVITQAGFSPHFYFVSELYLSGKMDEPIRTALNHADDIRRIYREVSGSKKSDDWFPLAVICEKCGKIGTTKVYAWDGEKVSYRCDPEFVEWARGCSHEGVISPFGGRAKLPFKVEWAAKWKVVGVDIEGAGKDHMTKGGAHDIAEAIANSVFNVLVPYPFSYEFFLVGGGKMSSSKGTGSSAKEIADLIPLHIFRLALASKEINQAFNFDPEGETIPILYDLYDKLAGHYFAGERDDYAVLFELIHSGKANIKLKKRYLPRFSSIAFLVQMPHLSLEDTVAAMKGSSLSPEDIAELQERADYAGRWLKGHAPEKYRFELQRDSVPERARQLNERQKDALRELSAFLSVKPNATGEDIHAKLHELKSAIPIEPVELFSAIYLSFLGKESGPKAGWFLSVLDRDFLLTRLREVSGE